jgi:hypothetical protein
VMRSFVDKAFTVGLIVFGLKKELKFFFQLAHPRIPSFSDYYIQHAFINKEK